MAAILKLAENRYQYEVHFQDGREYGEKPTFLEAVEAYRQGLEYSGQAHLLGDTLPPMVDLTAWPIVPVKLFCAGLGDYFAVETAIRRALELAKTTFDVSPGARVRIKVVLEEVDEEPTFLGAGI